MSMHKKQKVMWNVLIIIVCESSAFRGNKACSAVSFFCNILGKSVALYLMQHN